MGGGRADQEGCKLGKPNWPTAPHPAAGRGAGFTPASGRAATICLGPTGDRTLGVIIRLPRQRCPAHPTGPGSPGPCRRKSWWGRGEQLTASLTSAARLLPDPPHTRRLWRNCPPGVKVPRLAHRSKQTGPILGFPAAESLTRQKTDSAWPRGLNWAGPDLTRLGDSALGLGGEA